MLKKIRELLVFTIGPLFIVAFLALGYWWIEYGEELVKYADTVVLVKPLIENEVITEAHLSVQRIDKKKRVAKAYSIENDAIGLMACIDLEPGQQVYHGLVDSPEIRLAEDEKYFPMPPSWLIDKPDTLRRGDLITIYAMKTKEDGNSMTLKPVIKLFETILTHTMDSTNTEVESIKPYRTKGSASSSSYEIKLKDTQIQQLLTLSSKGYKFKFVYED